MGLLTVMLFAGTAVAQSRTMIQSPKAAEFASAPLMARAPVMPRALPVDMSGVIGWTWTGVTNASGYTFAYNAVGGPTNFTATSKTVLSVTNNWDAPQYKFQVNATNATATSRFSDPVFIPPMPETNVVISWVGPSATISSSPSLNIPKAQWPLLTNAVGSNVSLRIQPPRRYFTADKPLAIKLQ